MQVPAILAFGTRYRITVRPGARSVVLAIAIAATTATLDAQKTTRDMLDAPRVKSQIKVRLEGKALRHAIDDDADLDPIDADQLFVSSDKIQLTYQKLNPLAVQVSTSVAEVDDPGNAAIVKLLEALLKIPPILRRPTTDLAKASALQLARGDCEELTRAFRIVSNLANNLYVEDFSPESLQKQVIEWRDEVAKKPGAEGVKDVRGQISLFRTTKVNPHLESATRALGEFDAEIDKASQGSSNCQALAWALLQAVRLTNPHARLKQVQQIDKTLEDLHKALEPFANENNWLADGPPWPRPETASLRTNYVVRELEAKPDKIQTVTIKVATLTYDATDVGLVARAEDAVSSVFALREFSRFVPEIGAGLVLSDVSRPTYGTTTNAAGETVVAAAKQKRESYDAAVVLNLVCRCGWGPFAAPMFQIGASPNANAPAVLLGGGFRLFSIGKGNFAIGVGAILAWVKDLTELQVNQKVGGTKDIEADLSFQRRTRPYVAFLYNF